MGYLLKAGEKWLFNDGSDNGVIVTDNGSLKKIGTSYVYEDLLGSAMSWSSGGWGGSYININLDENTADFDANGSLSDSDKRAIFDVQLKHQMIEGTNAYFRMHWHWLQSDTTERTFELQYRKVKKGTIGGAAVVIGSWTTLTAVTTNTTNNFFTYSSGTVHQICEFDEIDITDMTISDIIQFRVARTDGNSGTLDIMYLDAHVRVDTDGSIYKWVKS